MLADRTAAGPRTLLNMDVPVGGVTGGKVTAFGTGLEWELSRLLPRNARQQAARKECGCGRSRHHMGERNGR